MNYYSDLSGPSYRPANLLGLLMCVGATAFAVIYLQGTLGLEPCPLCTATRLLLLIQAALFLLAFLHNPRQLGQRLYALLGLLTLASGAAVSIRHIWLQSLPADKVPECGPGLEYILQSFPLKEAVRLIFQGSGECAEVQWQLLGFTIPQQTLILFGLLLLIVCRQLFRKSNRRYFS